MHPGTLRKDLRRIITTAGAVFFVVLAALTTAMAPPYRAMSSREDTLTVYVTIDGIRYQEFQQFCAPLIAWGLQRGSYVENVYVEGPAITDPGHAHFWGSGDAVACTNWVQVMRPHHGHILRRDWGLDSTRVVMATGKNHLRFSTRTCTDPVYAPYGITGILAQSEGPPCLDQFNWQGPDSITTRMLIDYITQNPNVVMAMLNLSMYDAMTHERGFDCCSGGPLGPPYTAQDTLCYWQNAEMYAVEAMNQIMNRLVPFLDANFAGRYRIVISTDHGRHDDDVDKGFHGHAHGMDGLACAANCAGCRNIWAIMIGPGIKVGYTATGQYEQKDPAATIAYLAGIVNPYEAGTPIYEILVDDPTGIPDWAGDSRSVRLAPAQPNPSSRGAVIPFSLPQAGDVTIGVYDASGREVVTMPLRHFDAGTHKFSWDGNDADGMPAPSGTYFYRLRSGVTEETRKLTIVR